MAAGLIAQLPEVELERGDASRLKRIEPDPIESRLKWLTSGRLGQEAQLFRRGSEWIPSSEQA
jgi:hypothetical protein